VELDPTPNGFARRLWIRRTGAARPKEDFIAGDFRDESVNSLGKPSA
jgi:hypothetical protein